MTTASRPAPCRIPISFDGKAGLILLDQIRTLDKQRLVTGLGAVADKTLSDTRSILQEVFAE
jgi:mRNA interferase MazF